MDDQNIAVVLAKLQALEQQIAELKQTVNLIRDKSSNQHEASLKTLSDIEARMRVMEYKNSMLGFIGGLFAALGIYLAKLFMAG